MNITLLPKVFDVFRKGHSFIDAVKSGKQVAITAALGVLLAGIAPFIGGEINVHPWLAYFFTEQGIQVLGAVVAGVAGLVYHFGASAERGILPAKPVAVVASDGAPGNAPASGQGPSDSPAGGIAADAGAPDPVRRGSDDPAQSNPLAGGA